MNDDSEKPANPYAPPAAAVDASTQAEREGQTVTFAASDRLPAVCLNCGARKAVKRRPHVFGWIPPLTYLWLLAGLVPYLVVASFVRRKASTRLPLCEPCSGTWQNTGPARGAIIVGGAFAAVAALTAASNGAVVIGVVIAVAGVTAIMLAWRRFLPAKRLRLRRIGAGSVVTLAGVHPAAAGAIAEMQVAA